MRFLLVYKNAKTGVQRSKYVTLYELQLYKDKTVEEFFQMH